MMRDPRELFWEDEGLTEGLTDEEAQFLLGWLMDVDGQYGFVKTADVRTAASFVQLDWWMESSDQ